MKNTSWYDFSGEIVIIDDGSIIKDKPHLGDPLEEYIKQWNGLGMLI